MNREPKGPASHSSSRTGQWSFPCKCMMMMIGLIMLMLREQIKSHRFGLMQNDKWWISCMWGCRVWVHGWVHYNRRLDRTDSACNAMLSEIIWKGREGGDWFIWNGSVLWVRVHLIIDGASVEWNWLRVAVLEIIVCGEEEEIAMSWADSRCRSCRLSDGKKAGN